ncbi:unnamed protein product [Polarella glacialis]|uniref:Uncharacterized protein n=1 Tax=Polarella glacialis TaxID=89957 RepID=A0A813KLU0_POLGL|nr:unnamed protein product [Polarella glacialis]
MTTTCLRHEVTTTLVTFELPKLRDEPCWKRLVRPKKALPWLKRDSARAYPTECSDKAAQWREAYFYTKLHPELAEAQGEGQDNPAEKMKQERKEEEEDFEQQLKIFRDRAVPRTPKGKKGSAYKKMRRSDL